MFKIGEFSKLVRISARMLRYYDKCELFQPAETDRFTGYRLYSATQIPLLMRILTLRDMGFGVEEIAELLPRFQDAKVMKEALKRKQMEIRATIALEQDKLEKIAALSGTVRGFAIAAPTDVSAPDDYMTELQVPVQKPEGAKIDVGHVPCIAIKKTQESGNNCFRSLTQ